MSQGSPKTIADVMQTSILSVAPNDPLHAVQRLFYESGIQAAPVMEERGTVLGIITSSDLLRAAADLHETSRPEPLDLSDDAEFSPRGWLMEPEEFRQRLRDDVVEDFMTEQVLCVLPETPVSDVARMLRARQLHHVLVTQADELCGIASTFDLIALVQD